MPISQDRLHLYPGGSLRSPEWLAIRARIMRRAGWCCEGTPAHPDCRVRDGLRHPETGSRVVLTVAHMDQDPTHNHDSNLRALCQRCHLGLDRRHHLLRRMGWDESDQQLLLPTGERE